MNYKGIDISKYQKNIDWKKVKSSGIQFAIIRCSYSIYTDKLFKKHITNALNNSIDVGVYCYSEALNATDAINEANHVLELVKPYNLTYPVCYDMESNRLASLTNKERTDIAIAFAETVEQDGYYVSIYSSKNWLCNLFDSQSLSRYDIWLAQWGKEPTYEGNFGIWQKGTEIIEGIGKCDCDIAYKNYPEIIKSLNIRNDIEKNVKIGSKVEYKGYVHGSSFGLGKKFYVNGIFSINDVIAKRKYGILINNLGWVAEKDCTAI